jgi:hypothetical protein
MDLILKICKLEEGYEVPPSVETGCLPYPSERLDRKRSVITTTTNILFCSFDILTKSQNFLFCWFYSNPKPNEF